jgi:NAD(P)H-flavin reductase
MIGILGKGESMISISSSPTDQSLEFSVLRMGKVTSVLHECEEGDLIICGAYGNGFPVEFVPANLLRVAPSPENAIAVTFGPPVMIKFVEQNLLKLGFSPEQIYTTLEARMKCGIGKCGRCNIGNVYICKDGPVFSYKQIKEFLEEI